MAGKATIRAPANIALIKYWGIKDEQRTLPLNPSISMTLSRCLTTTTAEVHSQANDVIQMRRGDGELVAADGRFRRGIADHLERLRRHLGVDCGFRIATENAFPAAAGMASSASGFAALTVAVLKACGAEADAASLSALARSSGSGSAARSVLGGFVIWPAGEGEDQSHAIQMAPREHWELHDIIAVVSQEAKEVASREGHHRAPSSPYFEARLQHLGERLEGVRRAVEERDFDALAPLVEEEAIDLHLIAMSSKPPIFYWRPATIAVLSTLRDLRRDGVPVCATMDAGANVHAICVPESSSRVAAALEALPGVDFVIRDRVGDGPQQVEDHLF